MIRSPSAYLPIDYIRRACAHFRAAEENECRVVDLLCDRRRPAAASHRRRHLGAIRLQSASTHNGRRRSQHHARHLRIDNAVAGSIGSRRHYAERFGSADGVLSAMMARP